ncbi:helicase, RecD/TraA family [Clostridiales bacterium KA00134]|nr:helicase, RecD/TraA family [Clostridiales bacterium KA00134]
MVKLSWRFRLEIRGIIDKIFFNNEENGYIVFKLLTEDTDITCTGSAIGIKEGREYKLDGDFIFHKKYGEQFSFDKIEEVLPKEQDAIIAYLASGNIPFVGKRMAKRIVEKFKEDTFKILEENPRRLLEIEGIGEKKLEKIKEAFAEQKGLRDAFVFFEEFGISQTDANKIYRVYGNLSIEKVKENPYKLAEDIRGFGFKKADELARKMGFSKDSEMRIKSCIKYILKMALLEGHCFLPEDTVTSSINKMISVSYQALEMAMERLILDREIFIKKDGDSKSIYFTKIYKAENFAAGKLISLLDGSDRELNLLELDAKIESIEADSHKFAKKQKLAIREAVTKKVCLITGGPGTGKTTTLRAILEILESMGKKVSLAAPTGRAAKRMEESTGRKASTIHKLLDIHSDFYTDDLEELNADVVIIDEFSMVDLLLFNTLLTALKEGAGLIMVGDKDQLPSVGAGNVLRDIIKSGVISSVNLDEIFRQEKESLIVKNAHLINEGKMPFLNERGGDFFFVNKSSMENISREIVNLVTERLPNYYGLDPKKDIQVLSPIKKTPIGVHNLNKLLQEALNPKKHGDELKVGDQIFRQDDRVMQMKNNYQLEYEVEFTGNFEQGIFNGDTGIVEEVNSDEGYLVVRYDENKLATYSLKDAEELSLSYAITIHKSQGSEYPLVIIPMTFVPPILANRNLIYTAVTRASKLVVLVGEQKYLRMMVENNKTRLRYSSLALRILEAREKYDFFKK